MYRHKGEREEREPMLRVGLTGGLGAGKSAVALVWAEAGVHVISADEIGRRVMEPGQAVAEAIARHFGPGVVGPDGRLDRRALAVEAFERGRLRELNGLVHPAVLAEQSRALDRLALEDPGGVAAVESALIFEVALGEVAHGQVAAAGGAAGEPPASVAAGQKLSAGQAAAPPDRAGAVRAPGAPLPGQTGPPPHPGQPGPPPHPGQPGPPTHPGLAQALRARFDKLVLVTASEPTRLARYIARVTPPGGATPELLARLERDARARLGTQMPDAEKLPLADFVIENTGSLVLLRRHALAVLAALRAR